MRISHNSPSFVQPNALNLLNPKARQAAASGSQDGAGKTAAVANPGGSANPAPRTKHAAGSERRQAFIPPQLPANLGSTPATPRQPDSAGSASDAVSDTPSTTASAHAPAGPVTIDGFNKAWGATQPQYKQYDLDQNGTVDVDDLFKFINSMPGPGGDEPAAAPPTLDDIIGAWGQNGGAEDINGSGRVNIDDIFDFINGMPAPGGDGAVAGAPPKLDDILNAWGQNGGPEDINGSGRVNIDDVFDFINGMPTPPSGGSVAATESSDAAPAASATKAAAGPMSAAKLHRLTDSLLDHLGTAGFKDQPPTNIRQIVGRLNLPEGQADQVLSRVSARYPNGLGVNYMA